MTNHLKRHADNVYTLLEAAGVTDDLFYDGDTLIGVKDVYVYFTDRGADILFRDPYDGAVNMTTVTASHRYTAVATIVQGLLQQLYTNQAPAPADPASSSVDGAA